MQTGGLTITSLFRHGAKVHRRSKVLTFEGTGCAEVTFGETAERVERLASALRRLGIGEGDAVGTFLWNNQEHLEAYFALPCMGAVVHTLNIRLFPQQLAFIVNQARDRIILVNATVLPLLARVASQLTSVEHYILVDDGAPVDEELLRSLGSVLRYEELLAAEKPGYEWPDVDEQSAAVMCYTSGTTGDPKGVVYSHRSTWLHAFAFNNACNITLTERARALLIVPMFHVNAWGWPFVAWQTGADMVMPSRFLQGEPLLRLIELTRTTISAAVPSVLADLLRAIDAHPEVDISSLRSLFCGGSAVPRSLMEGYDRHGVRMLQGWGMTETSPVCTISEPPAWAATDDLEWRGKSGRVMAGVEVRIMTADAVEAPWDGTTEGEIEVRGPWVTGSYFQDPAPEKFRDGWLRTGDIGTIDDSGYLRITDRLKDVIKSGGEWISSVELETELMGHPDVLEASVVGVPDERWGFRSGPRSPPHLPRRPGRQVVAPRAVGIRR
jgi:fatty-acyl-CoA synthase